MSERDVRRAFAHAAESYDAAAMMQRDAGLRLFGGLRRQPVRATPRRIVDVGCGTGHGVRLLSGRWPEAEIIAVDFAFTMLRRLPASSAPRAVCADAQAMPLAAACADLVWSNLTLQWCQPRRFLAEAERILRPHGRLALSTLGPDTFGELKRAFTGVDGFRHTLDFVAPDELAQMCEQAGLAITAMERVLVTRRRATLRELLGEVRDIGANRLGQGEAGQSGLGQGVPRRPGLMGKSAWRRFEAAFEAQRDAAGLPLSYDLILIHAAK